MTLEKLGLGIAKGMVITFRHLLRRPITTQYPEQKLQTSRRIRGQGFVWKADLCTGCATCAKSCPHGIIEVATSKNGDNNYIVDKIQFDIGRCMFCGLCVEVCPFNALFMSREYEKASYSRKLLWDNKEDMMAPEREMSAYNHPELEEGIPEQTLLVYRKEDRVEW
ncbi:MAG: NADH-quinone oxidoreductase subunit I [Deltaproteobacteria bacterium]|nr:NADH-quinone oxidoreductase subunit I [Deltaproteobacteria bacterium]